MLFKLKLIQLKQKVQACSAGVLVCNHELMLQFERSNVGCSNFIKRRSQFLPRSVGRRGVTSMTNQADK